jgi:hypothetical protein
MIWRHVREAHMAQNLGDDQYREMRDIWGDFNDRQKFEHELIDRKTDWLLTTEGLLFAAYGFSSRALESTDDFRSAVAGAGLAIAAITLIGVAALMNSKRISWRDYQRFYQEKRGGKLPPPLPHRRRWGDGRDRPLAWGVRTTNTILALAPDLAIPAVFIVAWSYLLW